MNPNIIYVVGNRARDPSLGPPTRLGNQNPSFAIAGQPGLGNQNHVFVVGQPVLSNQFTNPGFAIVGQPVLSNQFTNHGFAQLCKARCNKCGPGQKHHCRFCGDRDSNHRARDCPFRLCKARGCFTCGPGQPHYCRTCENRDSNHRTRNCPYNLSIFYELV